MSCNKDHNSTDNIIKDLPLSQGSFERHKCAACAYEMGLTNGENKILNFNIQEFISNLDESQKTNRRHRSALEAYTLGFFHGLNGTNNHLAIKDKQRIANQMKLFGASMVARGLVNSTFSEYGNPYSHPMGLVQVANGFEILIKARIVEEHPLLIFSKIPKDNHISDGNIKFEDLLEHGQTIMYSELPDRLWATTGYKFESIKLFKDFGKIRNQIIHFAVPNKDLNELTLEFTFKVVEKSLNDWWDITILEFALDFEPDFLEYIFEDIKRLKLPINYKIDTSDKLIKIN